MVRKIETKQQHRISCFLLLVHLHTQIMKKQTQQSKDLFSQFVNWLNNLGRDLPSINRDGGSQDFFSKIMNRISQ